jgi:DNA-directed RNA polymerase subunit E'/Rpb7
MNNPYISTYLTSTIRIHPREMDNNISKHIKSNVEKEYINKCFNDFGFVAKIHELEIDKDAKIIPEDPMCCAIFKVKFLCTLCRPITNTFVIAKIISITEPLIILSYGPLEIIVKTFSNLNKNTFIFNQKISHWTAKKEAQKNDKEGQQRYVVLKQGGYLKVKILGKKIINKSKGIICSGYVENIATEEEIKKSITDIYSIKKYESIDEYINLEKKLQEIKEEQEKLYSDVNTESPNDNDL